jgi:hypothetical protein
MRETSIRKKPKENKPIGEMPLFPLSYGMFKTMP